MYWHGYGPHYKLGKTYHVIGKHKDEVLGYTKSLGYPYYLKKIREDDTANLLWVNDIDDLEGYLTAIDKGLIVNFVESDKYVR